MLAISRSLVCFTTAMARVPDAETQRTVVYLSGRGQMFLLPGADNHSYATALARQCKCVRFSLPLRTPTSDPTPIMPVKGTYLDEIDSLDQDPGIATLGPGMRFPGN